MNICKGRIEKEPNLTTDIPKSVRIVCILQLCIAFSVLLWILGAPFTESLYENKKLRGNLEWLTLKNPEFFQELPLGKQKEILLLQKNAEKEQQEPALAKIGRSIKGLLAETPVSKQLWLLLSLVLPVMVMKQVDGSRVVFLLLPVLTALYVWQIFPQQALPSLYPTESYLEKNYLKHPINGSLESQRKQLEMAWQAYIATEWSTLPKEVTENQKFANGLYQFIAQKTLIEKSLPSSKPGYWTLGLYFLWNLFAACMVNKKKTLTRLCSKSNL